MRERIDLFCIPKVAANQFDAVMDFRIRLAADQRSQRFGNIIGAFYLNRNQIICAAGKEVLFKG